MSVCYAKLVAKGSIPVHAIAHASTVGSNSNFIVTVSVNCVQYVLQQCMYEHCKGQVSRRMWC